MQLFLKGLIRGLIPFIFLLIISFWNKTEEFPTNSNIFFNYGLIFFFLGLSSVIYEIKHWKFSRKIIVHYLVMLITVFPTLILSGYYPTDSFKNVLEVYFQFNKVGIVLFLTTYLIIYFRNRFIKNQKSN
ncbi:Protein of unknown function [Terribacillus halophilus]|uniref:DUF3021 domain-containing protein n=1 Tax=Terribacillus halophilus TaxID=361279 RepID=A0A1G6L774_9BACI|nr:Protein of unknown function [Terribacillus halophilus]